MRDLIVDFRYTFLWVLDMILKLVIGIISIVILTIMILSDKYFKTSLCDKFKAWGDKIVSNRINRDREKQIKNAAKKLKELENMSDKEFSRRYMRTKTN